MLGSIGLRYSSGEKFAAMLSIIIFGMFTSSGRVWGQNERITITTLSISEEDLAIEKEEGNEVEFERPFNIFASAGVTYRIEPLYSIAISPVDNTIQFETVSSLSSGFAFGLVWNPLPDYDSVKKIGITENLHLYKVARENLAFALLVNVFQLNYSSDQLKNSVPIDVGFGIGYRKNTLLILGTVEFAPLIQPRQYFIDNYKDKNKQLVLSGSQEPIRTISTDDKSLFTTKFYPAIGIRVAYAFSQNNN